MYITYVSRGRLGNAILQYLATQIFVLLCGHTYVRTDERYGFDPAKTLTLTDEMFRELCDADWTEDLKASLSQYHIVCDGYFQYDTLYRKYRKELKERIATSEDVLDIDTHTEAKDSIFVSQLLAPFGFSETDAVVINLRINDFAPNLVDPAFVERSLKDPRLSGKRILVVCERPTTAWELSYLSFLDPWSPTFLSNDRLEDYYILRDAPFLIHSNSTFCWCASFFGSDDKLAFLPDTRFYEHQRLGAIRPTDHYEVIVRKCSDQYMYVL